MTPNPSHEDIRRTAKTVEQIFEAIRASSLSRAFELANSALQQGMQHPAVFNARALWFEQQGRYQDAMAEFARSLALEPKDYATLNALGLCLLKLDRFQEAIKSFDAALSLKPDLPQAHYRKGWAYGMLGDQAASRRAHEKAVSLQPDFSDALASLAAIAVRDGDYAGARSYAERSLKFNPRQPTAFVALAQTEIFECQFAEAERRIHSVLSDPSLSAYSRAVACGLLGDTLDGQDRVSEAFAAYTEKNEEFRRIYSSRFVDGQRAIDAARAMRDHFESISSLGWANSNAAGDGKQAPIRHVFLVGFPRSGTTLLERVLASNPQIVTLEEVDILRNTAQRFLTSADGLNLLASLQGAEVDRARSEYWQRVRHIGVETAGKVFVDKVPLNLTRLPVISKLFPQALVLFAVRDPRDTVFSGFRRHFETNAAMFELLRLEDGARFYDALMRLMKLYCERLPLAVHTLRYEDLVDDFDANSRAVCEFLGVTWSNDMRKFDEKARDQPLRSPSAPQVRRKLYREGMGQWRRYKEQMGPVLPILAPWIEHYGYSPD